MIESMAAEIPMQEQPEPEKPTYRRSVNRCHLIVRTPIYDLNGVTNLYYLEFTAGNMLVTGRLEPKHVPHVLTGFLMRRSLSIFIGQHASAMIALPLCRELLTFCGKYPAGRLVVHVQERIPPLPAQQQWVTALKRRNVRFAGDLACFATSSAWNEQIACFDYVIVRWSPNLQQDLEQAQQLKQRNPRLKIITCGMQTLDQRMEAFASSTDMVQSVFFKPHAYYTDKDVLLKNAHIFVLIKSLITQKLDQEVIDGIVRRRPYMQSDAISLLKFHRPEFKDNLWNYAHVLQSFGPYALAAVLAVTALHGLTFVAAQGDDVFAKNAAFETLKCSMLRARMLYLLAKEQNMNDAERNLAFIYGLFSIERGWAGRQNPRVAETFFPFSSAADPGLLIRLDGFLETVRGLENLNLTQFVRGLNIFGGDPGHVLQVYEHALIWSNAASLQIYQTNYSDFTITLAMPAAI